MKRREAIKWTTFGVGSAASIPALLTFLDACSSKKPVETPGGIIPEEMYDMLSPMAECIIPETETPGARQAGVAEFISKFVNFVYTPEQQRSFLSGLKTLNDGSKKKFKKSFVELNPGQQMEILTLKNTEALNGKPDLWNVRNGPFILMFKELTLLGYFTSMPGASQTLQYLPVPGTFEGCVNASDMGRAWATD